ncbi:hypothetical protein OOT46_03870 [Aquabacterium sp. A7-Y]|uniref:hypothetical protein n=1 Tax=Aquabacterium sp. A7-Y TaxID=1349605 RepID=UPI00223DF1BE|nr:hypothetical protein [Aquabacterium sp. A7-Y]MCW7536991.1 hypothetical protein [Aquabacterium sp. A7-Y]
MVKYAMTKQGRTVIETRCPSLERRLRPVLLLCNGQRSVREILHQTRGLAQLADLQRLIDLGLIEPVSATRLQGRG